MDARIEALMSVVNGGWLWLRSRRRLRCWIALVSVLICSFPGLRGANAAVIVVEDDCTLIEAITAANAATATAGCRAGDPDGNVIVLTEDVTLIEVDNDTFGANGLPAITSRVTVVGNGHAIRRADGSPDFRIFYVDFQGTLILDDVDGVENGRFDSSDQTGGGIHNSGLVALINTTVSSNFAQEGGGIRNVGTLTAVDSLLELNTTSYRGGGISSSGVVTLVNSTLAGNRGGGRGGGALYNSGVAIFDGTTVSDNTAGDAGGIRNSFNGSLTLFNTTVSGNTATYFYGSSGGGVWNFGDMVVESSTFVDNRADFGAGINNWSDSATMVGSIVSGNSLGSDCSGDGPFVDGGGNFDEDGSCPGTGVIVAGEGIDMDLADNGGPAWTHALLEGSPAIDSGGPCNFRTDQRRFLRADGLCDSGAFEFAAQQIVPQLEVDGRCPGTVTVTALGAAPGGVITIYAGLSEGASWLPSGPCTGTKLGIVGPNVLFSGRVDEEGTQSGTLDVPADGCGRLLQLVDETTCATTALVSGP